MDRNSESNLPTGLERFEDPQVVSSLEREEVTEISSGRIVTPSGVFDDGRLIICGTDIERVTPDPSRQIRAKTTIGADGKVVMPGIVDLHGDDIERHLFPRPRARIDTSTALVHADRTNVANGITTKFHAIAFENDPGQNRTIELAREIAEELHGTPSLLGDNRIHARCEVTESTRAIRNLLYGSVPVDMVSLMNHVPGEGQFPDYEAFERRYVDGCGLANEDAKRLAERRKNLPADAYSDQISLLSAAARDVGVPIASHDDETAAAVERMADADVAISEFPVSMEAAKRASELGLYTAMGAPNLVQGGSLWGNLAVGDAIEAGVLDVLCSDYHPPSLLLAPFVSTGEPLHVRVARVTENPARAAGFDDRGRLEAGLRADVIVVDPEPVPTVERAFVNGRDVFQASGSNRDLT